MATVSLVMAFDYGMKKIGVAVGQSITGTASPLTILSAKDGVPDWLEVEKLIRQWQPAHIVVGLPLNMDDSPSEMSVKAEKFARRLTGRFNIEHSTVDERLSSFEARDYANDNQPVDAIAAKLILETYFRQR
ncbi:MAG: Holliday junction resolvase RuvX [bacterium]|nr:Holliday junction resolvase RuvX [Gammaproteobacteria bacterium]HIL99058.1 Holliday junction resolvase RuvX [Pseudomonadales bacterium]